MQVAFLRRVSHYLHLHIYTKHTIVFIHFLYFLFLSLILSHHSLSLSSLIYIISSILSIFPTSSHPCLSIFPLTPINYLHHPPSSPSPDHTLPPPLNHLPFTSLPPFFPPFTPSDILFLLLFIFFTMMLKARETSIFALN